MANHYYTSQPQSQHDVRSVRVSVRGLTLSLRTDSGVFSRRGLDYGTRQLIEVAQLPSEGLAVDLGCGYGVVTAALSAIYPKLHWLLLDVNERAIELARKNTEVAADRRIANVSDGFSAVEDVLVDAVLLNPPIRAGKQVVYRLFEEARDHLNIGGSLWVVIQKKQGAASAERKLLELFEVVELRAREGGYHVFECVRG